MSKNIVIQEGGLGKQLTVDKLKTNLVGGGSCLWIPEDSVELTTKHITEDGTYTAASEGYYGYSEVSVNGIGHITGKKSDGNEYEVTKDSGGNLVETLMPSSIGITTYPAPLVYADGSPIDFTLLVVCAYDANDNRWTGGGQYADGVIPNSELSFSATVADIDAAVIDRYSDGNGINAIKILIDIPGRSIYDPMFGVVFYYGGRHTDMYHGYCNGRSDPDTVFFTQYNGIVHAACVGREMSLNSGVLVDGEWNFDYGTTASADKDKFSGGQSSVPVPLLCPESTVDPTGVSIDSLTALSGVQTITINWQRPDGEILETSFDITVMAQ